MYARACILVYTYACTKMSLLLQLLEAKLLVNPDTSSASSDVHFERTLPI